jgi:aspartokinase-like uncharacterized kinase
MRFPDAPEQNPDIDLSPLVVKLGGSLFERTEAIVREILRSDRRILLVPGGGQFADAVRQLNPPEDTAHWMAIAGMDQFGWYIHSFGIPVRDVLGVPEQPEVLLPYCVMKEADPLPHTWDITSDTISAWVAHILKADLLLLKSVDGIISGNKMCTRISESISSDSVDPCLIPFVLDHSVRTTIINGKISSRLRAFLQGKKVRGSIIDATF